MPIVPEAFKKVVDECIKDGILIENVDTFYERLANVRIPTFTISEQEEARRLAKAKPGEAVRAISGKTRWDWMPWQALHEVALVYTVCQSKPNEHPRGIGKYEPNNWISGTGLPLMGFFRAATSHMFRFFILREERDDETGCHHLAHAAWNMLSALETVIQRKGLDDRPTLQLIASPQGIQFNRDEEIAV